MNFYFSLFQLIETVEYLSQNVQHLASRALRISPRDARANRELLEQCESKLNEVKVLLNNKTHISKITLRKAAILFQILQVSYKRVLILASATSNVGHDDEESIKAVWQMLSLAQRHYQTLVKTLFDLTGIPVTLTLDGAVDNAGHDFSAIVQGESALQQESLKLLEKAIEVFGEEQELAEKLTVIRKDLLEMKKRMKHFVPGPAVEKAENAAPAQGTQPSSISKN
jgi:hypothetical protein